MIGILGNGSWATAIAKILTDNGHQIHWYMRSVEALEYLLTRQHNYPYLSSISFAADMIHPTNEMKTVLTECDTILICVPSAYLHSLLNDTTAADWKDKIVISAVKGIMPKAKMLLNEYMVSEKQLDEENYISVTGPCHAEEVALERLSYLTFSCTDIKKATAIAELFDNEYINTTINTDIWGTQYAAVLKNIYAIGAGVGFGLGYGDNFLSVFATNCYQELYQFLQNLAPHKCKKYISSAYLGDLLVTCYSLHSRNRRFGSLLGKGYSIDAAITEMGMMAEGYNASAGMHIILNQKGYDLPIAAQLYNIMWEQQAAKQSFKAIEKLMH